LSGVLRGRATTARSESVTESINLAPPDTAVSLCG
jgi:hypothetical protein